MDAFWVFGTIAVIILLIWAVDVYRHRHPLTAEELFALSRKRQRNRAFSVFEFSITPQPASPVEKKAMKSQGEFVPCDLAYHGTPARIAGLLKYKKHEWIVIVFINSHRAHQLWWNKGPDGTTVWSFLRDHPLKSAIEAFKPDAIAMLHNHPNPNPSKYRVNLPSSADLRSASLYDAEFSKHGISLLEFICDRGVPHLYYAGFADSVVPIKPIIEEIGRINGTNLFKNYSLQKELKRKTRAEIIPGGKCD